MIEEYVRKWLIKADGDLKVAENELGMPPAQKVTEAICFHAQQAAEKFLKAFLVAHKAEFGKTHNLEFLLDLCAKIEVDFDEMDTKNLTFYAVEVRYPDEFYTPTLAEAEESVAIGHAIKGLVLEKLGISKEDLNDWA